MDLHKESIHTRSHTGTSKTWNKFGLSRLAGDSAEGARRSTSICSGRDRAAALVRAQKPRNTGLVKGQIDPLYFKHRHICTLTVSVREHKIIAS